MDMIPGLALAVFSNAAFCNKACAVENIKSKKKMIDKYAIRQISATSELKMNTIKMFPNKLKFNDILRQP